MQDVLTGRGEVASAALFTAKHLNGGITEYTSRKTGYKFKLIPDDGGLSVECNDLNIVMWTVKLCDAVRLIELLDAN